MAEAEGSLIASAELRLQREDSPCIFCATFIGRTGRVNVVQVNSIRRQPINRGETKPNQSTALIAVLGYECARRKRIADRGSLPATLPIPRSSEGHARSARRVARHSPVAVPVVSCARFKRFYKKTAFANHHYIKRRASYKLKAGGTTVQATRRKGMEQVPIPRSQNRDEDNRPSRPNPYLCFVLVFASLPRRTPTQHARGHATTLPRPSQRHRSLSRLRPSPFESRSGLQSLCFDQLQPIICVELHDRTNDCDRRASRRGATWFEAA